MSRRLLFIVVVVVAGVLTGLAGVATAAGPPSGERIVGGHGSSGGTVIEPVYDDMTGAIRYVSTPRGTPNPVNSNPIASAPFYLPVYPTSSSVATSVTLNCQDTTAIPTTENCPDHGPAVAGLAQSFEPGVYGTTPGAVAGHDHLMAGPGSGGDFNVAWVPTLVLFTPGASITHITTLDQLNLLFNKGEVIEVPLNGTPFEGIPLPNLTFHCSVVPAAVYEQGVPFTG